MSIDDFLAEWNNSSSFIQVHTSGSTGKPKAMQVEKRRMEASARITCQFLGLKEGDTALLCLPLDYIAGKMMVVRALTCGLKLISVPPNGHPLSMLHAQLIPDFAAMVPLQVWNSLQVPEEHERLKQIRNLIIGGGAIDDALAQQLKDFPNAVWSTYGMTETLSHIALRRLNGPNASEWYTPFEGVKISLNDEGCLVIDAPAVHDGPLITNDIATFKSQTSNFKHQISNLKPQTSNLFRILGRKDNVICSGGIKVQAEEVERLLRPYLKAPFCVTRMKDSRLGEAVVLLTEENDAEALRPLCEQVLPRLWKPRHYISTDRIPLTETGKVARHEAEEKCVRKR
ncbi:MAG: AMP-binding protein [Prevotella sp.]|nr:AMP-binding protein [Prevotella sp.]